VRRGNRIVLVVVIAFVGSLVGCASKPQSTANGVQTLEGGVKIPTRATTPTTRTVNVTLSDQGAAGSMSLVLSPETMPAGDVTFVVKNVGTIEHEAVVLKTSVPFDRLPITDGGDPPAPVKSGGDKVSEDANVGETGDPNLQPGDTRTFTIKNMTAGSYVVVCNLAGHYGKGMRAELTIG